MAKGNLELATKVVSMGGGKKPSPKTNVLSQEDINFGNWVDGDTKQKAADLMRHGLQGADQLVYENQDTSSPDAIKNKNQSDWKISAVQNILANARRLGIRTPEQVAANKDVLIGNDKWKDAINNPTFNNVHGNFWDVISRKLLPQQWAKYDAQNQNNNLAAKS